MGGKGKKITVGYKYFAGLHMVLCKGPIDFITSAKVGDKAVPEVFMASGGNVVIYQPNLFGGEGREGGISGTIELGTMGSDSQVPSEYLERVIGEPVPAFRGVVSLIFHTGTSKLSALQFESGFYFGNNPYLKQWEFRASRINVRQEGIAQWSPGNAVIGGFITEPLAVMFFIDAGKHMLNLDNEGNRLWDNQVAAVRETLKILASLGNQTLVQMRINWYQTYDGYQEWIPFNESYLQAATDYLDSLGPSDQYDSNWADTAVGVNTFFNFETDPNARRILFWHSGAFPAEGIPNATLARNIFDQVDRLETYAININYEAFGASAEIDNTPQDGIPVMKGPDPYILISKLSSSMSGNADMNPVHIIRECLTDPDWGMGYPEAMVDDTNFSAVANVLVAEEFGISIVWENEASIDSFVGEILRHIDGVLGIDPVTGQFILKLIRDDYDVGSLITLTTDTNISRVKNYRRVQAEDLLNTITVRFWDHVRGEDNAVTAVNGGLRQRQGREIGSTVEYPGITNGALAARVAERDLLAMSSPLLSADITCNREAASLSVGDPFLFEAPRYHGGLIVMRVMSIDVGSTDSHKVQIKCAEDVFALPGISSTLPPDSGWTDPNGPPVAASLDRAEEATYYDLVQYMGQANVDSQLAESPDEGYISAGAARGGSELNAQMYVDANQLARWEYAAGIDFSAKFELGADVDEVDTVFQVTNEKDLGRALPGFHAAINTELVVIQAIDFTTNEVTVGRGVLDTAPRPHTAGSGVLLWGEYIDGAFKTFYANELADVQILPANGGGVLPLGGAVTHTVEFQSRAIRPYPPGNLQINGLSYPASTPAGNLTVTWAHRDRKQQTGEVLIAHPEGDIGPEPGTTYVVLLIDTDNQIAIEQAGITGTSYVMDMATFPAQFIRVWTERDGYRSLQCAEVAVTNDVQPAETSEWELIGVYDASGNELIITIPDDAVDIMIEGAHMHTTSTQNSEQLFIDPSTDGGTFTTTNSSGAWASRRNASNTDVTYSTTRTVLLCPPTNDRLWRAMFTCMLYDVNGDSWKKGWCKGSAKGSAPDRAPMTQAVWSWHETDALKAVRLQYKLGDHDSGRVYVSKRSKKL